MSFLVLRTVGPNKRALLALEYDCRTQVLMTEKFVVRQDFLASLIVVAAFELQLAKQIPGHSVYTIELTLFSAVRTGVWILLEPLVLAI